jgi:hypothetical protein
MEILNDSARAVMSDEYLNCAIRVGCHFEESSDDEKSCAVKIHLIDFSLSLEMTGCTGACKEGSSRIAQIRE